MFHRARFSLVLGLLTFAAVPAEADEVCFTPRALNLTSIQFDPGLGIDGEGAVIEIAISDLSDPSLSQTIRMPNNPGFLRLDYESRYTFFAPVVVPNGRMTRIEVNAIAVPSAATRETLDVVFAAMGELMSKATEAAFARAPLAAAISNIVLDGVSDEAKEQLQRGRIIGHASVNAYETEALGAIPSVDGASFIVAVEPHC